MNEDSPYSPFSHMPSPIFVAIPHFVFENASPELLKFIKTVPKHKLASDHCKPSFQLKLWKKYYKKLGNDRV